MPCLTSDAREVRTFDPHNNPQAEMLCTVLGGMLPLQIKDLPVEIQDWWKTHQARDARMRRVAVLKTEVQNLEEQLTIKRSELQSI